MKGTVSLWLEQEGGGRWEDLRETQSFQREWRRYYSLLENYKGGGTIDNRLSMQGVSLEPYRTLGGEESGKIYYDTTKTLPSPHLP